MESDRFSQALSRLDTAIRRLEGVAHAPVVTAPSADPATATRLAALEERHCLLREGASEALSRLDLLIAATPRPAPDSEREG